MDNKLLNLNGRTKKQFKIAMSFAFTNEYDEALKAKSWSVSEENGLVIYYILNKDKQTPFPAPITAETAIEFAWEWLNSENRPDVKRSPWCDDLDHDGSNANGWQIYLGEYDKDQNHCPSWGNVGGESFAICAIKPAYCWHGK